MLGLLELPGGVLNINLVRGNFGLLDSKKTHHATVEKVCDFSLHLHVDIFDQHAVYDGDGLEVDIKFHKFLGMIL